MSAVRIHKQKARNLENMQKLWTVILFLIEKKYGFHLRGKKGTTEAVFYVKKSKNHSPTFSGNQAMV